MNKNEFICNLNAEITKGEVLLDRFGRLQEYHDDLGDGMANFGSGHRHIYDPVEKNKLARVSSSVFLFLVSKTKS